MYELKQSFIISLGNNLRDQTIIEYNMIENEIYAT